MQNIGPYLAIITAIVAAFLTYRNQLKLKTFELFFERRKSVLMDIEAFWANLGDLQFDIKDNNKSERIDKYLREYFHKGLILYHKVKGANFGGTSEIMLSTFWALVTEPLKKNGTMSLAEFEAWISRTYNVLSALYGFSHSQITRELEHMSFSLISRLIRKYKNRPRVVKRIGDNGDIERL